MGIHMTATWPIQDVHMGDKVIHLRFANCAFGEMSVLFRGAAGGDRGVAGEGVGPSACVRVRLLRRRDGHRPRTSVYYFDLTKLPALTAAGYILSGAARCWPPWPSGARLKALRCRHRPPCSHSRRLLDGDGLPDVLGRHEVAIGEG